MYLRRLAYRDWVLILSMLVFFVTYFARLVFSPVVPFIIEDLEVSNAQIGLSLSGMWIAYGITQFPSGILAERFGEKRLILVAVGGVTISSFLTILAPEFFLFTLFVIALGATGGLHYSVATTMLSRTYNEVGTALGVHALGVPLAGLLAPVTGAWVGVRYGWRSAVALSVLIGVPTFLLFMWRVRPTPPRNPAERVRNHIAPTQVFETLARPKLAFTLFIAIAATFAVNGVVTFLPTFLVAHHGYTATFAGVMFSSYYVARGGIQIGVGNIADRYGSDVAIALTMGASGVGLGVLVYGTGLVQIILGTVLIAVGASYFVATDPRFMVILPDEDRNAGFGLIRSIYIVLGSTGSFCVGVVTDYFGWGASYGMLAAICFLTFLAMVLNRVFDLGY